MEINKKQPVIYTIFLLLLGSSITSGSGVKPEDITNLWSRVWKVEQPVTITLGEPIDVKLDEPIEVDNPSGFELIHERWSIGVE